MPADGGIRFGQYVLLRRIARGGMAEVFLAEQRGLEGFDRRVAVKRILPHLADSPDFLKMFLGEAKLAAQLTHPNIVHIYDFGKVEGDYFIAMEFVDGVHAGQLFKHGERELMPATLVARIGADAAAALHYAHELRASSGKAYGLVHRDVSPANIMVSYDGVVKLCDFGIAKAAALGDQLTNPGQVKGKYAYMSPEQTIANPLDGRSDVFSLSIVLWELLTGKFIVPRGDAVDAMRAIRDGKLEPIERAAPGVPPQLAKAITWGLQANRDQRATAMQLTQALEAFIKSAPELATPIQLGAWVRGRFARDSTGSLPALSPRTGTAQGTFASPGTVVSPGTVASPSTAGPGGSRTQNPVTPPNLIGASRVIGSREADDASETIAIDSGMLEPAGMRTVLDDASQRAAEEATLPRRGGPNVIAGEEATEIVATLERPGRTPVVASAAPTVMLPASGPRPIPDSGGRRMPGDVSRRATPVPGELARKGRKRILIIAAGLSAIAVVSFLIALAASGGHTKAPAIDAAAPDAARLAVIPVDAANMAPADAGELDASPMPTALLVIGTTPVGATIHVGDQERQSPTKLALPAGHYVVIAELPGYRPEKREVDLDRGVQLVIELVFTHKLPKERGGIATGRLTARTNPYSEVFENGRKLGETPFADLELPVGTHVLTFKNPSHSPVTKTVKILAGKSAKLSFELP